MKLFKLFIFIIVIQACNLEPKKSDRTSDVIDIIKGDDKIYSVDYTNTLYKTISQFNKSYIEISKEIVDSKWDGYRYYIEVNGNRTSQRISDSLRILYTDNGLNDDNFLKFLTENYKDRLKNTRISLEDPINMGYVLTQHMVGKSLIRVLSKRGYLNEGVGLEYEDSSNSMSVADYIEYHKRRIHIINDTSAVYKNCDAELSLEKELDRLYFIFKRINKNSKWLLDDVIVCTKEDEKSFDEKLIGESKPIEYYHPKVLDYEEQN